VTTTVPLESLVDPARPITYGIVLPGPEVPEGVPYVRVVDIKGGTILVEQLRRTTPEIAQSYRRSMLVEGDLVVSIRGHVGRTGVVPRAASGANLTQDTARVAIRPGAEPRFVRWFIESPTARHWMAQHTKGVAVTGINLGDLRKLPVPDVPTAEQRRIADILDKADAVRRKRKEAIALTEELLRSAFLEMFGDPVTNPKRWSVRSLDELDADFSYGTSTKCTDDADEGRAVLRIPNVVGGQINYSDLKYAKLRDGEARQFLLASGDILFVRSNGNPNYIARAAVFSGTSPMLFASYLIRARLPSHCPALPEFVHAVFSTQSFREQLLKEATTTAGNYNINTKGLGRQRIPLPPLQLQKRFVEVMERARASRGQQERYGTVAEQLFNSLVARAFSGGLSA